MAVAQHVEGRHAADPEADADIGILIRLRDADGSSWVTTVYLRATDLLAPEEVADGLDRGQLAVEVRLEMELRQRATCDAGPNGPVTRTVREIPKG